MQPLHRQLFNDSKLFFTSEQCNSFTEELANFMPLAEEVVKYTVDKTQTNMASNHQTVYLRTDTIHSSATPEEVLANAPFADSEYVLVPLALMQEE